MPNLLFVYGTLLQPGNPFADYLNRNCSYLSQGKTRGLLYDIGEYPGLILNDEAGYVFGSIYKIDSDAILKELDAYEGVGPNEGQPNLYRRECLDVETECRPVKAWVYVYNLRVDGLQLIPLGNYPEYLGQKKSPGS